MVKHGFKVLSLSVPKILVKKTILDTTGLNLAFWELHLIRMAAFMGVEQWFKGSYIFSFPR